ncbi:MFS general substrate transporter [Thozetella sp. PMI_491]|nr:MFS general substrate transporter [Thozetella sp. PMI_491]
MESSRAVSASSSHPFLIPRLNPSREVFMLATLVCTQVMVLGCLSQGIFPDEIIGRSFTTSNDSEVPDSTWGPAAYGLTSGAFMLPAGRIGDMGLQGLATAMLVPCALAILGSVYKEGRRKNLAFSLFAAGSPTGFTLGGVFSGLFAELVWWPWIFWATAITCVILSIIAYTAIPQLPGEHHRESTRGTELSDNNTVADLGFDWAGAITGITGLVLFNVAWNQAPTVGWSAPSSITTLAIGSIFLLAFLYVERRARQPLIPVDCLSADNAFVLATMALAWSSFGVLVFYLINFITRLRSESVLSAAAQFAPVPFAGFAASYVNSILLGRGVSPFDILAFACIWFIAGNVLLATMPIKQSFWRQVFWINVLAPLGIDLSFPAATLTISRLVPPERQGVAASLIATVVYYSQSIGLGIAGTVQAYVASGSIIKGYRGAFYTGIGLSSLSLIVAMWPVLKLRAKAKVITDL